MKENFCDASTFAGATLEKGRYKQFMLTAHVAKGTKPGLYTGAITLVAKDGRTVGEVPVRLRVLDFELPAPKTYFDVTKDFRSLFCEYVSRMGTVPVLVAWGQVPSRMGTVPVCPPDESKEIFRLSLGCL